MLPHVVLAGCGHAHLFVLETLAGKRFPPARVTLVSPDAEYFYSGMISGVVAGQYAPEEARLRPPRLAARAGAAWVASAVSGVDAAAKCVTLEDGRELGYDVLSMNIGSRLALDGVAGAEHGTPIRPFGRVMDLHERALAAARRATAGDPARIVVVGGGAGGWEIAMALDSALARGGQAGRYRITIVNDDECVLAEHPERVRITAGELLVRRGITRVPRSRVTRAEPDAVRTGEDVWLPYDLLLWAPGPRAPELFRRSDLQTDGGGYLLVHPTLQAAGEASIFGAGDCVAIAGYPWVARAGVYGVRQGPVLAGNLAGRLRGEPLESYSPQRDWLSLMNTGDGRALASYRGLAAHNRALWWLKNRIDRRFVGRFRRIEA
jgi:NADH dehydrogenase FAD-containing subunit